MSSADEKTAASTDGWSQIKEHFNAALDLEPGERQEYLRDAVADDAVRAEVESLLRAHDKPGPFLDTPVAKPPPSPAPDADQEQPPMAGRKIGAWRIIDEIGHGGMGTVYRVVRDDGAYQKEAALKLIRHGGEVREDLLRRFRQERQLLANVDHPNIAKLLDGGSSVDGRPYLVMEYVDGQPLDEYCETRNLSVEERLELFRAVCAAVQFAHQNLIVHRDLKPSNILVGEDGVPRLLDFGIAKPLDPELSPQTVDPTVFGNRPLTPEYASPEQFRGQAVTTATDTYSLGVVLYELLAGVRPFAFQGLAWHDVTRVVCEQDPLPPSTVVSRREGDGDVAPEVSEAPARKLRSSKKLARRLRGDLDNIVLRALRKEPQRRYQSVEQLSEDVRRHLNGLPVFARKGTFRYRAGKFVRRHWLGLSAIVLLIAFAAGMTVLSVLLDRQTKRAESEAAKAMAINEFLQNTLASPDPEEGRGRIVTVAETLDGARARIDEDFGEEPEVAAAVRYTIGALYSRLGLITEGEELLREALEQRREIHGEVHPEVADSLNELGILLEYKGAYGGAESLLRKALEIDQRLPADRTHDILTVKNNLAGVLESRGDYEGAEQLYREVLLARRRLATVKPVALVASIQNLAYLLSAKGDYEQSEALYIEALEKVKADFGVKHPAIARIINNLASLYRIKGDLDHAESLYSEALAINQELLGKEHPEVARGLNNLGRVFIDKGEYATAKGYLQKSLGASRRIFGEIHPRVADTLEIQGSLEFERGDYETAKTLTRESLKIRRQIFDEPHPRVANSLNNLGTLCYHAGQFAEAEQLLREALEMKRHLLGPEHPLLPTIMTNLGAVLGLQGKHTAAETTFREALEIQSKSLSDNHPSVAATMDFLAGSLYDQGNLVEAEPLYRQALRIRRNALGETHDRVAESLNNLALLMKKKGDFGEAERLYREALAVMREVFGDVHPGIATILANIAALQCDRGNEPEAIRIFGEAAGVYEQTVGSDHWRAATLKSAWGACLAHVGRYEDAETLLLAARDGLMTQFGEEHEYTKEALERLAQLYQVWRR